MTSDRHSDEQARLEEAATWIVRLQAGDADDALAFDAWLSASPENARAYDEAARVWSDYETHGAAVLAELSAHQHRRDRRLMLRGGWAAAASLAAAGLVAAVVTPQLTERPRTETYVTATGERRTVRLEDGSVVEMNAGSRLTVTLARKTRQVQLAEGQALFSVAKDARRPFVVAAGDRDIRVVGTRFDVRRRADQLSVTVAEGVVEVRPAGDGQGKSYRLRPGQRFDRRAGGMDRVGTAVVDEVLAWRIGRLVYRDAPLSDVIEDLNLQFARPIRLEGSDIGRIPVSGVLVLDDQEAVVRRLALLAPLSAVTYPRGIVLRRAGGSKP